MLTEGVSDGCYGKRTRCRFRRQNRSGTRNGLSLRHVNVARTPLTCDDGSAETEGRAETDGFLDGWLVGQSDTDGFSDG